jgi:hypothetical protein
LQKATEQRFDFKGYLKLAEEYLAYAKDAIKEEKMRLAIDAAISLHPPIVGNLEIDYLIGKGKNEGN